MSEQLLNAVRRALASVNDPATGRDLVSAGLVSGLVARDGKVGFVIEAAPERARALEPVRQAAERAVAAVEGVISVTAVLTAHGGEPPPAPGVTRVRKGARLSGDARAQGAPRPGPQARRLALPGVAKTVAVASGKGGVGKSTVAANLACALARGGARVGLLDADVYGPSAPILMGLEDASPEVRADKKLEPPVAYGVKVMSMGFLVDPDTAMIWRGPIVQSAITQMLNDVAWGPLDILVIDMPPGTGDAQLTLAQRCPLDGAVIVSTPQKLALADVRRGVEMFRKVHVPVLGVVENMSAYTDPASGVRFAPFGEGGARAAAAALDAPFLHALPLHPRLAEMSDAGTPPAAVEPESPAGAAFAGLARLVSAALEAGGVKAPPVIAFE